LRVNVHGFEIHTTDLFELVYEVDDWEFQIVKAHPPGRAPGWVARRTPIGRKRTALLTPPCDTPADAVLMLIRKGHLPIPPEVYVPIRSWKKNRYR
jgi:hypothetical protein